MANPTIRFKRGTQSSFGSVGLNTGEPAFITDEQNFYLGSDGTSGNNRFFGSARYWKKESTTAGGGVNIYGSHAVGVAGTAISLVAPTSVGTAITYTFPATIPSADYYLKTDATGTLSWASVSVGAASSRVETTTAPNGTFYPGLFVSPTGTASTSVYVDAGISYDTSTDSLTLSGDIAINGGDVTSSATTFNLLNTTVTTVNEFGQATTLGIGSTAATLTLRPSTVVGTNATQNLYNTVATNLNFGGAATALVMGAATGITTIRNSLRVTNNLYDSSNTTGTGGQLLMSTTAGIGWTTISGITGGTISTATRANTVDTITAPGAGPYYLTFVDADNGTATAENLYTDTGITYNASTNSLTISGDLFVNGTTTQVNTTSLTVEDTLIELGKVDGSVPSSDLNKDLGLLMNWNDGTVGLTSSKLAAIFWDDSTSRVAIATNVTESSGVLSVGISSYAPVEFKELYITDAAATADVVISYATIGGVTGRHLQNIIVDGGTF